MTFRALNAEKKLLGEMPPDFEYYDLELSRDEKGDAGGFAFHFTGAPLDDEDLPLECNRISMEFPHDFHSTHDVDSFVKEVLGIVPCDSAWFGLAFNHAKIFEKDARPRILEFTRRYHGLDVDYDSVAEEMRGKTPNANWYTFIHSDIADALS